MSIWVSSALIAATVATGLTAGLLFAFAHSVMPGLGRLDDHTYLTGFQRIDAAIQNPWMMCAFLGSPVLTLAAVLLQLRDGGLTLLLVVVAMTLILVTIAITASVHLPLNAAVQGGAPAFADAADLRERFEGRWVAWNWARAATSIASFAALCGALLTAAGS